MARTECLSDAQLAFIEHLLPSVSEQGGRPFRNNRWFVGCIVYRYRVGVPCLPIRAVADDLETSLPLSGR